MIKLHQ